MKGAFKNLESGSKGSFLSDPEKSPPWAFEGRRSQTGRPSQKVTEPGILQS